MRITIEPVTKREVNQHIAQALAETRITPPRAHRRPWPIEEPRYTPAQVDAIYADSRGDR